MREKLRQIPVTLLFRHELKYGPTQCKAGAVYHRLFPVWFIQRALTRRGWDCCEG